MARAVFFDRDGVLIDDIHLLTDINRIAVPEKNYQALGMLAAASHKRIVITNQTVVSRGLAELKDVDSVNKRINDLYLKNSGVGFHRFYVCPHHPNADRIEFRQDCDCRKPKSGMILEAVIDFKLNPAQSWVIGDRISDIAAGRRAGCRTILIETGRHKDMPIESNSDLIAVAPDFVRKDLFEAVSLILEAQIP